LGFAKIRLMYEVSFDICNSMYHMFEAKPIDRMSQFAENGFTI